MGSCQRACRFAASCGVHHPYRVLIRPRLLAGPFAHIVVDEAQELTDAEWQMLLLRCPSRSFTIVGDRVQARHGSRSRGRNGSSGSGSTGSTWPP